MSKSLIEVIRHSEQQNELWQWDTGRQIIITPEKNAIVDEVHFSNAYSKDALVVKPQVNTQGNIVADIPNILLCQVFPINVYVVMGFPNGKGTIYEEQLKINPRKKPSDYVYTETEILNYIDLEKRIKALEESGTGGGIAKETDPTVPQWAKEPTKPKYTADEVGAPTKEEFDKLSEDIDDLKKNGTGGSGLTTDLKSAMKTYFTNMQTLIPQLAFTTNDNIGATLITNAQAIVTALDSSGSSGDDSGSGEEDTEKTLTSISATYYGGEVAIGTALTDLTGIVVTATYSDGSTANVTDYTLSGIIAEGSNTITVTYSGKTTTFIVTGVYKEVTYTITRNLVDCTSSSVKTSISEGTEHTETITAKSGYTLTGATVSVTMGDADISDKYSNGVLTINQVTGNIVISVSAVLKTTTITINGESYDVATADGYDYLMVLNISGSYYLYASTYPFYIYDKDGSYYEVGRWDGTYRATATDKVFGTLTKLNMPTVIYDGFARQNSVRTLDQFVYSNHDLYEIKEDGITENLMVGKTV